PRALAERSETGCGQHRSDARAVRRCQELRLGSEGGSRGYRPLPGVPALWNRWKGGSSLTTALVVTRRMTEHPTDSHTIERYEATGGYQPAPLALGMTRDELVAMVKDSG